MATAQQEKKEKPDGRRTPSALSHTAHPQGEPVLIYISSSDQVRRHGMNKTPSPDPCRRRRLKKRKHRAKKCNIKPLKSLQMPWRDTTWRKISLSILRKSSIIEQALHGTVSLGGTSAALSRMVLLPFSLALRATLPAMRYSIFFI